MHKEVYRKERKAQRRYISAGIAIHRAIVNVNGTKKIHDYLRLAPLAKNKRNMYICTYRVFKKKNPSSKAETTRRAMKKYKDNKRVSRNFNSKNYSPVLCQS